MSSFEENIQSLPSVDWLERLEIYGDGNDPIKVIENAPGEEGSLAVYYKMALDYGSVCPPAAEKALEVYAEKVDEARSSPGRHPNIDFLFQVIEDDQYLAVRARPRA